MRTQLHTIGQQPSILASLAGLAVLSTWGLVSPTAKADPEQQKQAPDTDRWSSVLASQAGTFVPNHGQWDGPARFVHRSGPMTLFLEERGWLIQLEQRGAGGAGGADTARGDATTTLSMTFEGGSRSVEMVGERPLAHRHNYLRGSTPSDWQMDVPTYSSVRYDEMYPGIGVRMRQSKGVPEYDLLLEPAADLTKVSVQVEGGEGLSIAADGSLVIETPLGPLTQPAPLTWQTDASGAEVEVACRFVLQGDSRFGFEAPGWDPQNHLTIDPGLMWSTFFGGWKTDSVAAFCVLDDGKVALTGYTHSINYPKTPNGYQLSGHTHSVNTGFIAVLDPSRSGDAQLVYSTFLGGSANDQPTDIHVDKAGVITVFGNTFSSNYPTSSDAFQSSRRFSSEGFVTRLDPSKTGAAQLLYSSFFGGDGSDRIAAGTVDSAGVITIAGTTDNDRYFPLTPGARSVSISGPTDAFISVLDPKLTGSAQLLYSTLLGGLRRDSAVDVAVSSSGLITVIGHTDSTFFPTTANAYQKVHLGLDDIFVCRLDPKSTLNQLRYSTLLGGSGSERAQAMHLASNGAVTMAGYTRSAKFPTTPDAYSSTMNTGYEGFVCRLMPGRRSIGQLEYSTYIGGAADDFCTSVSVAPTGIVTVGGYTDSSDYPTTIDAFDRTLNGKNEDAFVSQLDLTQPPVDQLIYSTYFGKDEEDRCVAVHANEHGEITVAGTTFSPGSPVTSGAFQTTHNGPFYEDSFVCRISTQPQSHYLPDGFTNYGWHSTVPFGGIHVARKAARKKYQVLVTAADLGNKATRTITDLGFVSMASGVRHFQSLQIRMAQTSATSLTTGFAANLGTSNVVTVLSQRNYHWHLEEDTWQRVGLEENYHYDASLGANIVIEISVQGGTLDAAAPTMTPGHLRASGQCLVATYANTAPVPSIGVLSNTGLKMELVYTGADAAKFGLGREGSNSVVPTLDVAGQGQSGMRFDLTVAGALPNAMVFYSVGLGLWDPPLDLGIIGGNGCKMYHPNFFTFLFSCDSTGSHTLPLSIPYQEKPGFRLYFQAFPMDSSANSLGLSSTNYVRLLTGR